MLQHEAKGGICCGFRLFVFCGLLLRGMGINGKETEVKP